MDLNYEPLNGGILPDGLELIRALSHTRLSLDSGVLVPLLRCNQVEGV